jgi:hypothetical protein
MSILNAVVARLVDGLLFPFQDQSPLVGLAAVSLLLAVVTVAVVHAASNHVRLSAVTRALQACVLEVRLFNDDLPAMLRALAEMVRHNLTYARLMVAPLAWLAVPVGLLVAQLDFHYGYGGLEVGQPALIKVRMREAAGPAPVLTAPHGIRIETPAVWIPSLREAAWRIAAEGSGDYELTVQADGNAVTKRVRVSNAVVRRSPVRADRGFLNQLQYPSEAPLPDDSPVESIAVTYPRRDVSVLGRDVPWLVVFFAFSIVFALALRVGRRLMMSATL